jgi:dTDP-glucose 4,6-dehydratase
LAEKIIRLCKTKSEIVYTPKNYVDVELRIPSIEKAQQILKYKPEIDLNTGIIRTFKFYKNVLK